MSSWLLLAPKYQRVARTWLVTRVIRVKTGGRGEHRRVRRAKRVRAHHPQRVRRLPQAAGILSEGHTVGAAQTNVKHICVI